MADVLQFPPRRNEPSQTHLSGEATCLACGHNWVAVAPTGCPANNPDDRASLECPRCTALKGVFKRFTVYDDCPTWHCARCSGFLFTAFLAAGDVPTLGCASCGHLINALDLWNPR